MASRTLCVLVLVVPFATSLLAHGGGLDKNGCHTNRKTGDYHCHGGGLSAPAPSRPAPAARPTTAMSLVGTAAPAAPCESNERTIRAAQILLKVLGHPVTPSGSLDLNTIAAIRSVQKSEYLAETGQVDPDVLVALAKAVARRK